MTWGKTDGVCQAPGIQMKIGLAIVAVVGWLRKGLQRLRVETQLSNHHVGTEEVGKG